MNEDGADKTDVLSRRVVGGDYIDVLSWATPDEGALEGEARGRYFSRKQAVSLYLSGASAKAIQQQTSLGAKQAYRLIRERCLTIHADGRPYGWRGLIPYARMKL